MAEVQPGKAELRAAALARRAALAPDYQAEAAQQAVAHLTPLVRPGQTVALFWPMRGEIDPRGLIVPVLALGGQVAMPAVDRRGMVFRLFADHESMQPGVFGTRHPHESQPAVDPDLIVAPLAAFDRRGGRIGYGGGYYDRAVAEMKAHGRAFRIAGIAFACQEVEAIPVEAHDEMLPAIATERELIVVERPA